MTPSESPSERPPLIDQLREVPDFRDSGTDKSANRTSSARRNQVYKSTKAAYLTVGKVVTPFHEPLGMSIQSGAELAAEAWDEVAAQNPAVKNFILTITQGTAWAKLISAHLQIALPFLAMSESVPQKLRDMAQGLLYMQMAQQMAEAEQRMGKE